MTLRVVGVGCHLMLPWLLLRLLHDCLVFRMCLGWQTLQIACVVGCLSSFMLLIHYYFESCGPATQGVICNDMIEINSDEADCCRKVGV